ncbi:hypothetical protein PCANC_20269 [Puccinia coronata f. sp. avenae]|uniref:Uncharacterized protein n=1 Tax=Puccinia coronata f. sp. avenae TaxID=200324 RepID=A0A2N5SL08_9BASI|nr:hypothetical protein PCANC_20269 [Puccinia coronata f. sp. avenae]
MHGSQPPPYNANYPAGCRMSTDPVNIRPDPVSDRVLPDSDKYKMEFGDENFPMRRQNGRERHPEPWLGRPRALVP